MVSGQLDAPAVLALRMPLIQSNRRLGDPSAVVEALEKTKICSY
jgi:hypothetical protein